MKKSILILLIQLLILSPALAERTKVAQVGMQFLKIGIGARAVGMGEACVANLNDLSTIFWNPGALALVEASGIALYQTNWLANIKQYAFAGAYDLKKYGMFGLSFIYMDYPTLTATRPPQVWEIGQPPHILGEFDIAEFAIGLTYSRSVSDKLTVGGQIKYIFQDLGNSEVILGRIPDPDDPVKDIGYETKTVANILDALGFDFGSIYHTGFKSLRFAMVVQHFSKDIHFDSVPEYKHEHFSMPLTFKIGLAMAASDFLPEFKSHQLTLSADLIHPRDFTERVHLGMEYWYKNLLALRGGYKFNYDSESFTGGVGFRFTIGTMKAHLNYSISDFGEYFNNINRFEFGFQF